MKRKVLIIFFFFLSLFMVGCGKKDKARSSSKQVKCSKTASEGGASMSSEVVAVFDRFDVVSDVSLTYDFGDEKKANMYCDLFKATGDDVSCTGTKVIIKNLDSFEDNEVDDSEKLTGKSKDEFIKAAEADGFSCQ